ncbi:helix-turn-helix domain-containing protein [Anaerotignum propionicum]|jgi:DNA-binding HxlR family transcriptional regulator|uniref:winged helix-turn-helix transcriptional regulator n=1 Tax=Anaerotignum propionicum TaxID=28446 RepID=UPI00289FF0DD|nr:helix-turn-helix domain-containing protein [Anaerotignum propionicum]MEA4842038.1 helix-turn-helix domain-containing protein [[Clostridium] symbiosum]
MKCNAAQINCPVGTTIDIIGGKYKSLILWHLIDSTLRFGELSRLIPQATPKMLTQQLRELEEANLIDRKVYPVVPPRVDYSLTELGISMRPILEAMYSWGQDYLKKSGREINCSMKLHMSAND